MDLQVGAGFDLRVAILDVMKYLQKTEKYIPKESIFKALESKNQYKEEIEREIELLMDSGEIKTAFDQNHLVITS